MKILKILYCKNSLWNHAKKILKELKEYYFLQEHNNIYNFEYNHKKLYIYQVYQLKIVSFYNKKDTIDNSIKIVTDQNKFFEVSSCIDKYITYSQNDDYDNLINIINSEYIKENNI